MKLETLGFSETMIPTYGITWYYIPEYHTINSLLLDKAINTQFLLQELPQHFMEHGGSLPCSQEPSTGLYPEPD
jgi:hypothetical protein